MNTPSANDLLTARMSGRDNSEHLVELDRLSRHLEAELLKARAERDLAMSDTQIYPTASAYELVCQTLDRKRLDINRLIIVLREIREITRNGKQPLTKDIHEMSAEALSHFEK